MAEGDIVQPDDPESGHSFLSVMPIYLISIFDYRIKVI
jgi:hypothetical protein